jgi:ubiquinone/menaquinone biosynthesis C-methylase UbiE
MGGFSFKTMTAIHDNPLRRLLDNPFKTVKTEGLKPGSQVLEIGCGPGFFTVPAAQLVGKSGGVYAIDINPRAIEMTRKKVNKAGLGNVQLRLADAADIGLADESIDVVLIFGLLHSLPLDSVLPELARVLKPGGFVAVRGIRVMSLTKGGYFTYAGRQKGVSLFRKEH